jgi:type VI protein secretion system component Hcp
MTIPFRPLILTVALLSLSPVAAVHDAEAVQILACMSATPISIGSDPLLCPQDRLVEVATFGWSVQSGSTAPSAGSPTSPGLATSTFQLTKKIDRTSPTLFFDAVSGRILPSILLVVLDGTTRIFSVLLNEAAITSMLTSATGQADGIPIDTLSIVYRRVTTQFQSVQQCWDFATRTAC